MLGADVVVTEGERLAQGQLQDLLGARREGDLTLRRLLAGADDAHDRGAHLFDGHFEPVEDTRRDTLLLTQEAEEQVLGADVVVLEGPGLFLGEDHDLPGAFGESFEHPATPSNGTAAEPSSGETGAATGVLSSWSPRYPVAT